MSEQTIAVFAQALDTRKAADDAYKTAKAEWEAVEAAYASISGVSAVKKTVTDMLSAYGPTIAKWIGGPAAGAGLAGIVSDPGAFSGLTSLLGKFLGVLGIG